MDSLDSTQIEEDSYISYVADGGVITEYQVIPTQESDIGDQE